jgi:pyrophosphate--fructose-6-phosphate 1-phosphotransferase
MRTPGTVGILTAGGLAPCLSSAVGGLIEQYTALAPHVAIRCYRHGYRGLLAGDSVVVSPEARRDAHLLHRLGGSPIGSSRVRLTNAADCLKQGLIQAGDDPRRVAMEQLATDGVDILHTIGGDDTNTAAADLAAFMAQAGRPLVVVGLPKTVDNDVYPIRQSLGAATAADQGARFFDNVVAEHSANPRMLLVHEVMGRGCGWLTAATAARYRERLAERSFVPALGVTRDVHDIHGVYLPELDIDLAAEAVRLTGVMDRLGCVNLFVAEGAGVASIVRDMQARGEAVPLDAFGHPKLDAVNPGAWFAREFATRIGAAKTLVQKSGYFARSAPANAEDLDLIARSTALAARTALDGISGVVGEDQERDNILRPIELDRIRGGKPFDVRTRWFVDLLCNIGQSA